MQKGRRTEARRPIVVTCEAKLEGLYVRSLQALWTLGYFEFNRLAIVESLVAISQMAEKWTKTSSPLWRWMNPKPLLALNHFTVPCSLFTAFTRFCQPGYG